MYITGNRGNAPPEKTQSLPASSRESSTEPMDTDDARRASEEIYRRIRQQAGLTRSGSVGDITLQPEPLGIMTQGKLVLRRKAKLKKARQQLNVQANPQQVQVGGGATATTPAQAMPATAGPTTVMPPQANVPRKAQVGRPARVAKPKPVPPAAAGAPKKVSPPKPPATRSKTRNQPTPTPVAATDLEADVTAPVDAEYDTDELAELPTDSESEAVESEQGEDPAQLEGQ